MPSKQSRVSIDGPRAFARQGPGWWQISGEFRVAMTSQKQLTYPQTKKVANGHGHNGNATKDLLSLSVCQNWVCLWRRKMSTSNVPWDDRMRQTRAPLQWGRLFRSFLLITLSFFSIITQNQEWMKERKEHYEWLNDDLSSSRVSVLFLSVIHSFERKKWRFGDWVLRNFDHDSIPRHFLPLCNLV